MKKLLLAGMVLCLAAGMAAAEGMNPGGALLLHVDESGLTFCQEVDSAELPETCEELVVRTDAGGDPMAPVSWVVVAAFPENVSPALKALEFGIEHDVEIMGWYECDGDAVPYPGWPQSGTGTAHIFRDPSYELMTECITFVGYAYYSTGYFKFIDHPSQGAPKFLDTQMPGQTNDVEYFGELGFFQDGVLNCPPPLEDPVPGACCVGELNEICVILLEEDCLAEDGEWIGEGVPCDPDPCGLTPVIDGSWGSIKANYR